MRIVEAGEPSQEMIKFVEDKAFVGEPKSSLVMLESKVKAVNPTYAKVSEVDKRITVRC